MSARAFIMGVREFTCGRHKGSGFAGAGAQLAGHVGERGCRRWEHTSGAGVWAGAAGAHNGLVPVRAHSITACGACVTLGECYFKRPPSSSARAPPRIQLRSR